MFTLKDYVLEVYKTGNFSRAAENLYISQPSLSASIRRLEKQIGEPLFDRSTHPVRLTPCGEAYIRTAQTIVAAEKNFENKIKKYLDEQGCYYIKHFANAFTKVGVPDLLCCINGYFVGIEVKAPNGRPSELQLYNIKKIKESDGFGLVLYPDQFEDFKTLIKCLMDGNRIEAWKLEYKINKRW